jgi:hypothetical protein
MRISKILPYVAVMLLPVAVNAADDRIDLKLLVGSSWQVKNDVQIPNTDLRTRFSLADTVGEGPVTATRVELNWMLNDKHGVRLLFAPLSYNEPIEFTEPQQFNGESFAANTPTTAGYRFNSWRIGYHYTLTDTPRTTLRVGGTLKIRDAEIRLEQNGITTADDDLGVVPLFHIVTERRLNDQWYVGADADALAGGPGRAIDAGIILGMKIRNSLRLGAELRVLEGGADIDSVYNFAQFNSASLFIGYRW